MFDKKKYPDNWREISIGELGKTYSGLTGKDKDDFGKGKPFISYMNIYSNPSINLNIKDLVDVKEGENQNKVKYGDIFFTTSSETPEEVGVSSVLLNDPKEDTYLNSFCFGFRLDNFDTLLPEFAQYYFRSQNFRKQMFRIAQGASRYNLSKKYFLETKIHIPKSIDEQKRIVKILRTLDKQIYCTDRSLKILKDQKKYLIENLVEGSIRMPENIALEGDVKC